MTNPDTYKDDLLIDNVLGAWGFICRENHAHKDLVTQEQFESWLAFKNNAEQKMKHALNSYSRKLTDEGRAIFEQMANTIVSATHKTEQDLRRENSTLLKDLASDTSTKKKRWLNILGR